LQSNIFISKCKKEEKTL